MVEFTAFWSRLLAATIGSVISLFCFTQTNQIYALIYWGGIALVALVEMMFMIKARMLSISIMPVLHMGIFTYLYNDGHYTFEFFSALFIFYYAMIFCESDIVETAVLFLAIFWITIPCYLCFHYTVQDYTFIIRFLCIVWFMDAGAYFSGHIFGRTPLLQSVSPKKTWEGSIGGSFVTLLVAHICSLFDSPYDWNTWMTIGLISVIFGQLGDLFESFFKRIYGVKDSGVILLGHGGLLDRYDSVFSSIVILHIYLSFF
jgi:phosphatidate cytidylyltransferase